MADLWAIARFDLKLTTKEFGRLTPKLFDLLLKRKEVADKQEWRRAGVIAAAVVNFSMCHPEKMVSPEDFVPGKKEPKEEFDLQKLPPEEQARFIKNMFAKKEFRQKR